MCTDQYRPIGLFAFEHNFLEFESVNEKWVRKLVWWLVLCWVQKSILVRKSLTETGMVSYLGRTRAPRRSKDRLRPVKQLRAGPMFSRNVTNFPNFLKHEFRTKWTGIETRRVEHSANGLDEIRNELQTRQIQKYKNWNNRIGCRENCHADEWSSCRCKFLSLFATE